MMNEILVVDDSAAERLYIGHLLKNQSDFSVCFANDGMDAIEVVAKRQPRLIVSDLRMPGMSGLELVRRLKSMGHSTPVVLMTSFGSEEIAVRALQAGAASYVPKLVLATDLIKTIRNVMAVTAGTRNRRRILSGLRFFESHFVLDNCSGSITPFISHVLDTAIAMNLLQGQEVTQVGIALQEALSNAINHGNLELDAILREHDEQAYFAMAERRRNQLPYSERKIFADVRLLKTELSFTITDEGRGFKRSSPGGTATSANLDRIDGRGLLLINCFMDSCFHNDRGNQITMIKYAATGTSAPSVPETAADSVGCCPNAGEEIQTLSCL